MDNKNHWSLYEVFVRSKQGLSHRHVGSLRASDDEVALQNARDVYTRRNEGVSIWDGLIGHIHLSEPLRTRRMSPRSITMIATPCDLR